MEDQGCNAILAETYSTRVACISGSPNSFGIAQFALLDEKGHTPTP